MFDQRCHQCAEKGFVTGKTELAAISHSATEDATEDVVAAVVTGHDAVGDGETQGPQVVGDDAEGDGIFHFLREGGAIGTGFRIDVRVGFSAELFELAEDRLEDVGGVVGRLFREVGEAFGVLNDGTSAFEAHAGIDVFGGQFAEGAVGFGIVLDEDEVPDLDAEVGVVVDQCAFGIAFGSEVDVEFRARAARAGFTHHPEVVLHVAVYDLDRGVAAFGAKQVRPEVVGFLVELAWVARLRLIDGGVEPVWRDAPALDGEFPCPRDGFLFEIVTERPVAEHLEERVVIGIVADIFEVVVLAAGADAFLGVGGARRIVGSFFHAEEIRHERVHAGIGEQQTGRLRQQRGGWNDGVLLFPKEIEEALADLGGGHDGG